MKSHFSTATGLGLAVATATLIQSVSCFAPSGRKFIGGHGQRQIQSTSPPLLMARAENNNNDNNNININKEEDDDGTWIEEEELTSSRRDFLANAISSASSSSSSSSSSRRRDLIYNAIGVGLIGASGVASWSLFQTNVYTPSGFTRFPNTQFIAALADPTSSSNDKAGAAQEWGLWRKDPGPRGVWLRDYEREIVNNNNNSNSNSNSNNNMAPAGWTFDAKDWWLEEHGLIMEAPQFPLSPGRYLVTGGRMVTTGLTVNENGSWKLDEGTLYDVTHLPCRSARYTPSDSSSGTKNTVAGSPLTANPKDFPVAPGAIMPSVPGCNQQDYAVLFLIGKATAAAK